MSNSRRLADIIQSDGDLELEGKLGVGTNNPVAALHVNGTGTWIRHTGDDGYVDVGNWYSGEGRVESDIPLVIRTGNVDSPISIAPAGVTGLYVDESKNVGIGNTNPAFFSSYTNLRIGSSEANSAGLIKFSSSYNSEDGAEIYQAAGGDIHINRDSSTNLMSLSVDKSLSIANSKLPAGAGTFNYFTAKGSSFAGFTTETGIFNNAYYNSTAAQYRTVNAGASSRLYFSSNGNFIFETAPSVAADTANNFGVKMLLETDKDRTNYSNLLINKSSSIYDTDNRGGVEIDGIDESILALTISGTPGSYLYQDGSITTLANVQSGGQIKFIAGGSHHATLDHTGTYTLAKYASSGHNAGEFNIGKSTVGAIHLNGGTGSGATDARSIAITHEANGDTQAAIVFENNNTDGTRVAVFTTQSYGVGPQRGLEVTNRGEVLKPRNPSFLAYHTSGTKPAGVQVFTDVWSNVAAGYNTSNGRFTAAVAGAYQINAALLSANNSFIACYLEVNGSTILYTENTRAENNFAAGHINATVYLNAGDYVTVTSGTRDTYGSKWCYFSGHLIG